MLHFVVMRVGCWADGDAVCSTFVFLFLFFASSAESRVRGHWLLWLGSIGVFCYFLATISIVRGWIGEALIEETVWSNYFEKDLDKT